MASNLPDPDRHERRRRRLYVWTAALYALFGAGILLPEGTQFALRILGSEMLPTIWVVLLLGISVMLTFSGVGLLREAGRLARRRWPVALCTLLASVPLGLALIEISKPSAA